MGLGSVALLWELKRDSRPRGRVLEQTAHQPLFSDVLPAAGAGLPSGRGLAVEGDDSGDSGGTKPTLGPADAHPSSQQLPSRQPRQRGHVENCQVLDSACLGVTGSQTYFAGNVSDCRITSIQ